MISFFAEDRKDHEDNPAERRPFFVIFAIFVLLPSDRDQ
jgi:hypothetical protein